MWKLIFGTIVIVFIIGCVFLVGFVLGTTTTPLNDAAHTLPSPDSGVVSHV